MDLDQSGNPEQTTRVYLGPSLGWVQVQIKSTMDIIVGGSYNITPGTSVVLINTLTPVVINLPDVKAWLYETAYMPSTGFERAIIIKDLGGNAPSANIVVAPFPGQTIDYTGGNYVLNQAHQVLYLLPLKNLAGWYATSQTVGSSIASTTAPGGTTGQVQYNNAGTFAGFTVSGDATLVTSTGVLTIAPSAVTYAKMQNVSATNKLLGRITAGAGPPEELTGVQATSLLSTFTSTLAGLAPSPGGATTTFLRADGTWAAPSGAAGIVVGSTVVTGGASGSFAYNNSGIYGEQTPTQVTAALNVFTPSVKGLTPSSGGGTINFLRADGSWAAPTVGAASMVVGSSSITGGATGSFLYDNAGVLGERTAVQATAALNLFTTALQGLTPASGGGTVNFLRADGTWATPGAGGGITVNTTTITGGVSGNFAYNNAGVFGERTPTQATAALNIFNASAKGLTPASGGGGINFVRADGSWVECVQPSLSTNFTVGYTFTPFNAGTPVGSFTPNGANGNYQFLNATGSLTIQIPPADCVIDILITNASGIVGIFFGAGYSVGANVGDPYDITIGHKFIFTIKRINGTSTWFIKALQ